MTAGPDDVEGRLYDQGLGIAPASPRNHSRLRSRFVVPPFSVLNTRDGYWQERKRGWLALGIQSEVGRDAVAYEQISLNNLTTRAAAQRAAGEFTDNAPAKRGKNRAYSYIGPDGKEMKPGKGAQGISTGISIFDPVLCELAYRWWAPPGGIIVDPFAGGSVRGVVASVLGYRYWGCELRQCQVDANRAQVNDNTRGRYAPKWHQGDSLTEMVKSPRADFLFSCPPYGGLEVYSDDPADISNRGYGGFAEAYTGIIGAAADRLRDNRFACFVVGNYREGHVMRDLVGLTTQAAQAAGMWLYNEAVLINAVGTAAMRANTNFVRGARKLVKSHQNVLVYVKGDAKLAAANVPASDGYENE